VAQLGKVGKPGHARALPTNAFEQLWAEGVDMPRLLSIGLHLRMIGRPGIILAANGIKLSS
jgi:hypothetical protein